MEIKVEKSNLDINEWVSIGILSSMKFWNNTGQHELADCNNPDNKKDDDLILDLLLTDCKTFCNCGEAKNSGDKYECGRTRSHIWVHINDERIFMFYIV